MNTPLISIVICTYNGERFLKYQLDSILNQTYPNLEIIISDDASTDGTKAVLEAYKKYENVQLVFNDKNIGFAKNFEAASRLATGNFIAFSDQDDIFLPHKMERLINSIGSYSLIYSDSQLINEKGEHLNKKLSDVRHLKSTNDSRNFFLINAVSGHTMLIRKEVLNTALPIPVGFYHDWWMAIHAANLNGIIYLDEVLSLYRQHPKTVTKTIGNKRVPTRKMSKRWEDLQNDISLLNILRANKFEKNQDYLEKLYRMINTKASGNFSWALFFFLWREKDVLFSFWRKSLLSQFVEIRKLSRGERNTD